MSTQTTAVAVKKTDEEKGMVEYVPFGAQDSLKLSVAMIKKYIAVPTRTGKTASDEDCIKFIAMCKAKRLNPFEGDAFLIGFDSRDAPGGAKFNLITAHQAFLKRAEVHPEFDGMESGVIVKREETLIELEGDFHFEDDAVVGGWAVVHFKNRKYPMRKRLRVERFKKQFGVWAEDAGGMICKCAEADALRSSFPTMLGGLYTKEEMLGNLESEPKTKEPLFGNTLPETIPVEAVGVRKTPVEQILDLCKQDNILERDLVEFVVNPDMGMGEESSTKVSELPEATQDSLINQWEDFSAKLKAALNPMKGKK